MTRIVAINPTEQCRDTHVHEHQGKLRCVLLAGHDSTVHRCATATWDAPPKVNTLTGCLTGYGVEQATAALIRDDSVAGIIVREQVKIYAALHAATPSGEGDDIDTAYELIVKALIVHGAANTHQDADRILHKLVQAHRNGVRL
jgi:hypothetical protein